MTKAKAVVRFETGPGEQAQVDFGIFRYRDGDKSGPLQPHPLPRPRLEDLRKAYNEQRLDRRLRTYRAPKILIIDEMGVYAVDQLGASLLFQLVAARYEKSSIILTSNKGFAEWGDVLGDPVIATAVLDRLLHHSHILNIKGDSYRLREKRKAGLLPSPFAHEQAALHSRGG